MSDDEMLEVFRYRQGPLVGGVRVHVDAARESFEKKREGYPWVMLADSPVVLESRTQSAWKEVGGE